MCPHCGGKIRVEIYNFVQPPVLLEYLHIYYETRARAYILKFVHIFVRKLTVL